MCCIIIAETKQLMAKYATEPCREPERPTTRVLKSMSVAAGRLRLSLIVKARIDMNQTMVAIGMSIVVLGVIIEFVAFAAMAFYPVRRFLPLKSPIQLQSTGCAMFCLGVVTLFLARLF